MPKSGIICAGCGLSFIPSRVGRPPRYCTQQCYKRTMRQAESERILASKATPVPCVWCQTLLIRTRSDQKFCSSKCNADSWRNAHTAYFVTKGRERRKANPGHIRELMRQWHTEHPDYAREATRRRHARKRGAFVKVYSEADIYERDMWQCQLCGKAVNRRLRYPHPMSRSIDHIIPLTRGGTDEPANVQLAHFRCNVVKGNRLTYRGEQLRLV